MLKLNIKIMMLTVAGIFLQILAGTLGGLYGVGTMTGRDTSGKHVRWWP